MPRDVKTMPEAATLLALQFGRMSLEQTIKGWRFVAAACNVLDLQEYPCAHVPDGSAYQQTAKTSQHCRNTSGDTVTGDTDERQQQAECPGPGKFYKIAARQKSKEKQIQLQCNQ